MRRTRPDRPLHVQLWSYNYAPEPTGIGPVSTVLAEGLREHGDRVEVIAAHPHYPSPEWGKPKLPAREERNGIPVLRLPLWVGKGSAAERYRQELTYMAAQFASLPLLGRPDVLISTSPSFPALLPGLLTARLRRVPWLLWLQDILPDGAASTGLVEPGLVLRMARRLERAAYRNADLIVVPSHAFVRNLREKDVPAEKLELIPNPPTRSPNSAPPPEPGMPPRIISMGNIGFSHGLARVVEAFERSPVPGEIGAELVITGTGAAAEDVRAKIVSERVRMLGVVDDDRLEQELARATIGLVSQERGGIEFNIPSRMMNLLAYGLPVLAVVDPESEVARIVTESGAGWVVDNHRPDQFPEKLAALSEAPDEIASCAEAAREYAGRHYSRSAFLERFGKALETSIARAAAGNRAPLSAVAGS